MASAWGRRGRGLWLPVSSLVLLFLTAFLLKFERKPFPGFAGALGFKPLRQWLDSVKRGAVLLTALLFFYILAALVLPAFFSQKELAAVSQSVLKMPLLALLTAVSLGPLAEEVFFRGFLQQRVGVFFSSAVFAGLHFSYASTPEVLVAFAASVLIGLEFRKNKDLNACIAGHALFNAVQIGLALSVPFA